MSLLDLGLPKWPQMYTSGAPVTLDQAKEIIRRTDYFFTSGHGGNDHNWNTRMIQRMRMPHGWVPGQPPSTESWPAQWARREKWQELWGCLDTQYVHNSWLSCAYVFGPHGWCHPDGRIAFVDNIGKWPAVEEVLADWAKIAAAFPFLDLAATLMDREYCEGEPKPVVTFLIADGLASVAEGSMRWHEPYPSPFIDRSTEAMTSRFMGDWNAREHGPIPSSWFGEWEKKALEVDASMRDWVHLDEDCIHDCGDIDDGWRKENARREREEQP